MTKESELLEVDAAQAYFERGFLACHAWHLTKKPNAVLSDAVLDHAWDHREEGGELPTIATPSTPGASEQHAISSEATRPQEDEWAFAAGFHAAERALGFEGWDESEEALEIEWAEYRDNQPSQAIPDASGNLQGNLAGSEAGLRGAWNDGFQSAKDCLTDDEAFTLTDDVRDDAWTDSRSAALAAPHPIARAGEGEA